MSLFKFNDICYKTPEPVSAQANATRLESGNIRYVSGERLDLLSDTIGQLHAGDIIDFETHGAWSNIELLEYILIFTGPARVYFSTWSISADAITRFTGWQQSGQITDLFALLDKGIRNRKPELYQMALGAFPVLKYADVHAKSTVIETDTHHIVLKGSANYTKNPRLETGMIIWNRSIAESNIKWILEEIYK